MHVRSFHRSTITRQNGQPTATSSTPVAIASSTRFEVNPSTELLFHPHAPTTGTTTE
jgi:hypothetical protein